MCLSMFAITFCSCKRETFLLNERQAKFELSTFIFEQLPSYGGPNIPASRAPKSGITNFVYSQDKDGFQVMCQGNVVTAVHRIFQPVFGNPALARTNATGLSSFVYAGYQAGVAVNCGLSTRTTNGVNQEFTHLVVANSEALKSEMLK